MAGLFGQLNKIQQPKETDAGGLFKQLPAPSEIQTPFDVEVQTPVARVTPDIGQAVLAGPTTTLADPSKASVVSPTLRKAGAFASGVIKSLPMLGIEGQPVVTEKEKELLERQIKAEYVAQAEEPRLFQLGRVAGSIPKFAASYAALGPAVETAAGPLLSKLPAVARPFAAEMAKDIAIGAPLSLVEELSEGKTGKELVQSMGANTAIDAVANLVFMGAGRALKGLTRADVTQEVAKAIDTGETLETVVKQTQTNLGVPETEIKGVTALKEPVAKPAQVKPEIEPVAPRQIAPIEEPELKPTRFTQTALESDATGTELQRLIDANPTYYKPTTEEGRRVVAKEIVESNEEAALALVKSGDKFQSDVESAIGLELIPKLQEAGRFDEALEVIQAISRKGSKAGQFVQQMAAWSKSSPEGMLKWADKILSGEGIKLDADTAENITKIMNDVNQVNLDGMKQTLLDGGLKSSEIDAMQLDRLKALNVAMAQKQVVDKLPISVARKISTYQAISHLLNAKTMGRNLFGNTTFALAENLSKVYGRGFDKLMAAKTGIETTALPKFAQPFQQGVKRFKEAGQEIKLGVELGRGKYDLFRGKTFKKGVLSKLEEALSKGLKQPDEAFKGFIESQSLYSQVKARIGKAADAMDYDQLLKNATPAEIEQAQYEALYATFQDNSLPAQILQGAKDIANKVGIGQNIRGPSGIRTKEFGLGDLLVKYTKVPGNILSRGVEYTPAGYIKGLLTMNQAFKTGSPQLQRQAANAFGRATNGTSMIALAVWLADKKLIVSEDKDRSYDARALDRAEGLGNYKLNVSALNRLLLGESTEPQAGDELVSYNWNQPVATSLALGSSTYEQLKKQGVTPQAAASIVGRASEELLDLPTLYTIQQMFYEGLRSDSTPIDIALVPLTQGASGFIPGPVRQVAQFTDPTFRETRGETQFETAKQKVISGIPGLRETLEPRISPLGEEVKAKTGVFETFISPSIVTEFQPSEVTPFLKKVEDLTGEDTIFPQAQAPKSVTVNKVKLPLTPQERTEYQRIFGESVTRQYTSLLPRVPDPETLSDSQLQSLVKRLEEIKRNAREEAKNKVLRGR